MADFFSKHQNIMHQDWKKGYQVLYTKDVSKKRKVFHDGTIELTARGTGCVVILRDSTNKEICRKTLQNSEIENYEASNEVTIGQYVVQVEQENSERIDEELSPLVEVQRPLPPPSITRAPKMINRSFQKPANIKETFSSNKSENNAVMKQSSHTLCPPIKCQTEPLSSTSKTSSSLSLDPSLQRVMRPHQV
jgi:hypothetical protein